MTLKEQILFLIDNKLKIFIGSFLFGILGLVLYFLIPVTYTASGFLYISRSVNTTASPSPQDFTYEGYYARQNAVSYVPTVVGFIESDSTSRAVLEELQLPVNTSSLRKFGNNLSVKKPVPQLVEVAYKSLSQEQAVQVWKTLTKNVISKHYDLNADIDSSISIKYLAEEPIVKESFRNPILNFFVGVSIGIILVTFSLAFKAYLFRTN